jgi:hypothetical protein
LPRVKKETLVQPLIVAVSRESPPLEEATAQTDTSVVDREDSPAFETEPPPSFLLILLRALSALNT